MKLANKTPEPGPLHVVAWFNERMMYVWMVALLGLIGAHSEFAKGQLEDCSGPGKVREPFSNICLPVFILSSSGVALEGIGPWFVAVTLSPGGSSLKADVQITLEIVGGARVSPQNGSVQFLADEEGGSTRTQQYSVIDDNVIQEGHIISVEATIQQPTVALFDVGISEGQARDSVTFGILDDDFLHIRLDPTEVVVREDVGVIEHCLTVTNPEGDDERQFEIFVNLLTVTGSADHKDYQWISFDSTTFGPLSNDIRSLCFNLTIVDDDILELEEYFSLWIFVADTPTPPDSVQIVLDNTVSRVTLLDDESLLATMTPHVTVEEGETAHICINVTQPPPHASLPRSVLVAVSTQDGSADTFDFEELSFTVQLNETHRSTCFSVSTIDNILAEMTETFTVKATVLEDPFNALILEPNVSTITIMDSDFVSFGFRETQYNVSEAGGSVTVAVETYGNIAGQASMLVSTIDVTAKGGDDFEGISQDLIFTSTAMVQEIEIAIYDDSETEVLDEHFLVQISSSNGEVIDTANVVIIEDDYLVVSLNSSVYNVTEGQNLTIEVVKESYTDVPISVEVTKVFQDSAFPECRALGESVGDYESEPTSLPLTFAPDELSKSITVQIINDVIEEETEHFGLSLTLTTEGAIDIGTGFAVVEIYDEDRVSVEFADDLYKVTESSGEAIVYVRRYPGTDTTYPILVSTFSGNATGEDYSPLDRSSSTIPSSRKETEVRIPIHIVDDDIALEGEETFSVNLSLSEGSRLLLRGKTLTHVVIIDDDKVLVQFRDDVYVVNSEGMVDVSVEIDKMVAQPLPVTVLVTMLSSNTTSGTSNFTASEVLTFSQTPNLTSHVTFDLRKVDDVESLNITIEVPEGIGVVIGERAWATLKPFIEISSVTEMVTASSPVMLDESNGDSKSSQNTVAYAVGGSLLGVVVLLIIVVVAMMVYLRWRAYSYRVQPRFQGTATNPFQLQLYVHDGDQSCEPRPFVRGSSRYFKHLMDSNQHIPGSCIHLVNCIGKGQFGVVYNARLAGWQNGSSDGIVAVKTLKAVDSQESIDAFLKESLKMKGFSHPNVLSLIGVSLDASQSPYIVMPYMANGSLLNYLKKERPNLTVNAKAPEEMIQDTTRQLLSMCLQVAKGMEYLAERSIVHRDLAARNCMIDASGVIKVADFGLSESLYTKTYFREGGEDVKLPVKWMAIESLRDCVFTEKSDVWSFGVTCWETFSLGSMPYAGVDSFAVMRYLVEGHRLEKPMNAACSDQVYKVLLSCWAEDPDERPNFSELTCTIATMLEGIAGYMPLQLCTLSLPAHEEPSGVQEWSDDTVPTDI